MHRSLLSAVLSLSVLLSTLVAAQDVSYTFTTIDVPNAYDTYVGGINTRDQIVGTYLDSDRSMRHGFIMDGGQLTTFDFPDASETDGIGINVLGQIVGAYVASNGSAHGFFLNEEAFTTLDVPFSGAIGTTPRGINTHTQIVGDYTATFGRHGFLKDGEEFTTIDFPGSCCTQLSGINDRSQIVGSYKDAALRDHGFLLFEGTFTIIEFPSALYTSARGINNRGQIVGTYINDDGSVHGFILERGKFTTLDFPGACCTQGTQAFGISDLGYIVGIYQVSSSTAIHSFIATPQVITDTTPPVITITASPATLSPPNGKLVDVLLSGMITDASGVQTSMYEVIDEYGQIHPSGDVTLGPNGGYAFTVPLPASRQGNDRDGRHYTIEVSATDMAGNSDTESATVTVPRH